MSREDETIVFGIGILAGVVAGIAAGILFAPESGEDLRKRVDNSLNDIAEKCPTKSEVKRQTLATIDIIQYKIEKAVNKIKNTIKAKQLAKAKDKEQSVYGI